MRKIINFDEGGQHDFAGEKGKAFIGIVDGEKVFFCFDGWKGDNADLRQSVVAKSDFDQDSVSVYDHSGYFGRFQDRKGDWHFWSQKIDRRTEAEKKADAERNEKENEESRENLQYFKNLAYVTRSLQSNPHCLDKILGGRND